MALSGTREELLRLIQTWSDLRVLDYVLDIQKERAMLRADKLKLQRKMERLQPKYREALQVAHGPLVEGAYTCWDKDGEDLVPSASACRECKSFSGD